MTTTPSMGVAFVAFLARRWRFVAAQAIAVVVVVVVVMGLTAHTRYDFTAQFVLHPSSKSNESDVANGVSVLRSDDPLVPTVLKVLGNGELLQRAGSRVGVRDVSGYSISATVSPGSSFFDTAVTGPDRHTTAVLGKSLETVASSYVAKGYRGFELGVFGSAETRHTSFPPSPSVLVLALLLGAAAAAAELFGAFAIARVRPILDLGHEAAVDREARPEPRTEPLPEPRAQPEPEPARVPQRVETAPGPEPRVAVAQIQQGPRPGPTSKALANGHDAATKPAKATRPVDLAAGAKRAKRVPAASSTTKRVRKAVKAPATAPDPTD